MPDNEFFSNEQLTIATVPPLLNIAPPALFARFLTKIHATNATDAFEDTTMAPPSAPTA
jgi:hypothetical protein